MQRLVPGDRVRALETEETIMPFSRSPLDAALADRLGVALVEIGRLADAIGLLLHYGTGHEIREGMTTDQLLQLRAYNLQYALRYLEDVGLLQKETPSPCEQGG